VDRAGLARFCLARDPRGTHAVTANALSRRPKFYLLTWNKVRSRGFTAPANSIRVNDLRAAEPRLTIDNSPEAPLRDMLRRQKLAGLQLARLLVN
jgi:hypothetical protein